MYIYSAITIYLKEMIPILSMDKDKAKKFDKNKDNNFEETLYSCVAQYSSIWPFPIPYLWHPIAVLGQCSQKV